MKKIIEFYFKKAPDLMRAFKAGEPCVICGCPKILFNRSTIPKDLAKLWKLGKHEISLLNQREGEFCVFCGGSLRVRHLARAILDSELFGGEFTSFYQALAENAFEGKAVCEINACGTLHNFLCKIPALAYSEFGSRNPHIPSENLAALSYKTGSFDLLVHSDTLEHVPDLQLALSEIKRVLKPGGISIFTVPIIPDGRKTRQRAIQKQDGLIEHLLPPTYHGGLHSSEWRYLVYYEFGVDFYDTLRSLGFDVRVSQDGLNPLVVSLLVKKRG